MTAAGTFLARSISLQFIPAFIIACFAIPSAPAQQQAAPEVLEYKGTLGAARQAEVAPRLDGLLLKINFTAGQLVKQGDLLFEFGSSDKELSVALAQAHLKQAEAQLRLAAVKLQNAQTLRARNVASQMQLLEAEAQRDLAAAKADEARANVGLAELALQQMKLFAPMTGIISRSLVTEGTYITKEAREQSRLATIVQLDPIRAIGQAPAAMYFQRSELHKSLAQGAEQVEFALVLPTGDKYPHKGRIVAGDYQFNPATQTVEVTVEFPNPDLLLRPGLNVTLQSSIRTK
jgi:RND family efflux transporter MFP subunit